MNAITQHAYAEADERRPMPPGLRDLLLAALTVGYPAGYAQTRLQNAPDDAIAWQVQSMLDDYADPAELASFQVAS